MTACLRLRDSSEIEYIEMEARMGKWSIVALQSIVGSFQITCRIDFNYRILSVLLSTTAFHRFCRIRRSIF